MGQFTASGTAVSGSAGYGPWGAVTATSGVLAGQLGFQSGWTDAATGKVAMGSRWYSPSSGGFISADSVQVSPVPDAAMANPFAYVGDSPLSSTDPTGHCGGLFSFACSVVHRAARAIGGIRRAVARSAAWEGLKIGFARLVKAARPLVNVVHGVYDAARSGIHAAATLIRESPGYQFAARTYHAAASYASRHFHEALNYVKTTWHRAVRTARSVARHVAGAARSLARGAERTAGWVGSHVQKAAAATGSFLARNAAAIGGVATGLVVMAGCEADAAGALATDEASTEADAAAADTATAGEEPPATGEPPAGEEPPGESCPVNGGRSFTAATPVLLASGKAEPISKLHAGQEVLATDTRTGKDQPETVTAVLLHHDTNLYDLKVSEHGRAMVIHTTSNHLFWVPGSHGHGRWVKAAALRHGTHLRTPGGHGTATVTSGWTPRQHDGWMWDLTIPGNGDHDFYVLPADSDPATAYHVDRNGVTAVLVHNCGGEATVHLDFSNPEEKHALITVRSDSGEVLSTHQFGSTENPQAGVETFDPAKSLDLKTTINVTVRLPNADAAMAYAEVMIDKTARDEYPEYSLRTQSCVTYCANVLRAGGVEGVPTTPGAAQKWFLEQLG